METSFDDTINNIGNIKEKDFKFIEDNIDKIKSIINFIEKSDEKKNGKFVTKQTKKKLNKQSKCKYGMLCCNTNCKRFHPIGWNANEARERVSNITCKFGEKCTSHNCPYKHTSSLITSKENLNEDDDDKIEKNGTKTKNVSISPIISRANFSVSSLNLDKISGLSNIVADNTYQNDNEESDNMNTRSSRSLSTCSNTSITSKPQQNYLSLNVEYIANGFGHNDRIPCWIVISDLNNKIIFNEKIDPNKSKNVNEIVSTLEPITGITMEMLENEGKSYNEVIRNLKLILNKDVVFIGHNVDIDLFRLGLEPGIDYKNYIDITIEFRIVKKYGSVIKNKYFSLEEEKKILLDMDLEKDNVNICEKFLEDTKVSMSIFKNWIKPGETKKARAKKRLTESKFEFNKYNNNYKYFVIDGVCCSQYRKDRCICS